MTAVFAYGLAAADFPHAALATLSGLGGAPVTALPAGLHVALVSPLPPGAGGEAARPPAAPVARTRRNLLAHTHVLETCHRAASVLPFRFGTVAPDAGTLTACIAAHRTSFAEAMRGVAERVELGVRASFEEGMMFPRLAQADPGLRAFRDRLRARPEAETYYERIELGRRVEAALAALRAAETARLTNELASIAERFAVLPGQEESVIFNHAYLVPRESEAAFDQAIGRLAERAGAGVALRYVGPMPPFNFVRLQAGWLAAGAEAA